jgi:hypothetical protein
MTGDKFKKFSSKLTNDKNTEFNYVVSNNNSTDMDHVKKVIEYNTNFMKKQNKVDKDLTSDNNITKSTDVTKNRPQSIISNFSHLSSAEDNIKLLNEFKNNIDGKINFLKQKLLLNNSNVNMTSLLVKLNYTRFCQLTSQCIQNILIFFDTNDLFHILNINKAIRKQMINGIINSCKLYITSIFDSKFAEHIQPYKKTISLTKYKKNKKAHTKINLILQAKILNEKLNDKTVFLKYKSKFNCDKTDYINTFIFDVKKPGPLCFWVMKEFTSVSNNIIIIYYIVSSR